MCSRDWLGAWSIIVDRLGGADAKTGEELSELVEALLFRVPEKFVAAEEALEKVANDGVGLLGPVAVTIERLSDIPPIKARDIIERLLDRLIDLLDKLSGREASKLMGAIIPHRVYSGQGLEELVAAISHALKCAENPEKCLRLEASAPTRPPTTLGRWTVELCNRSPLPVEAQEIELEDGIILVEGLPMLVKPGECRELSCRAALLPGDEPVLSVRIGPDLVLRVPVKAGPGRSAPRELLEAAASSAPSRVSPAMREGAGLSDVWGLLQERLGGLVEGPGCGEEWFVRFSRSLAPEGFEGEWACCRLGCGGWGCAYRCSRGGETVVVKVPRGFEGVVELGDEPTVGEAGRRLLLRVVERAEVLHGLRHPGLLRLLGASRSVPLLVYEYGDGGSLWWQVENGWEPGLGEVVLVGVFIGDALRYIHSRGLVHGDVKAENVFIVEGRPKLGDFSSVVRLLSRTSRLSRAGYTPGWRAPEQVYADLRRKVRRMGLESRMDVYMLGNLLLYLLTGETVDGEEIVIDETLVHDTISQIEDEELATLIAEMLDPQPWERPSSEEAVKYLIKIYKRTRQ